MGQQQILLLLLVVLLIGLASILSINVFTKGVDLANRDAIKQDLSNAASYVQAIWERPSLMGGANRRFKDLDEEIILQYLNIPATSFQPGDSFAENDNGTYSVEVISESELVIKGVPKSGPPDIQITVSRDPQSGQWAYTFSDVVEE